MLRELGEASWISISDDGHLMRLNWTLPESALCDAFLVNYTVTTLTRPKSFSIATADDFSLIKFFANHTLDMRVFCMIAGSLSKTWWAHRVVHLTNPMPVRGARVTSSTTDEFYVSRITIDWEWPPHNDFDLFEIVVSYGIEERSMVEIAVSTVEPIVISDLEPAQRYRIAIRNQSVELGLKSSAVELTQITAPIISSTVFPGKISSTSININFGESDVEQGRFDYYELVFAGNNKNITKRIDINQEKSLTFTNLIPGKTYVFALSTVYKGQRSRTVTESVTTYPLKVNALYPVIGREYVVLYWDIENFADSNCRFRLSYNAERVSTVTVDLRDVSRHRFSGLLPDVFYTFTITVVMGAGNSTAESESEMVTVYVPKGRLTPSLKRQGSRELIVKFENDENVFSPLNGAIDSVAVIVSDDTSMNDDYYELRSWSEVSTNENWGAYRALWRTPYSGRREDLIFFVCQETFRAFRIGYGKLAAVEGQYCNGILRANGPYKVKLRAYTNTNAAMESDWIAIDGTEEEVKEEEKKNQRRFPCHMYINGCPWESNANHESSVAVLLLTWLALL
ncbi:hypothetical protein Q1695_013651 [Nippostrongylus brasiliensis]|nr:hypothetical protein Q1695_013651 [Nippostrongylus brasiliensis]